MVGTTNQNKELAITGASSRKTGDSKEKNKGVSEDGMGVLKLHKNSVGPG